MAMARLNGCGQGPLIAFPIASIRQQMLFGYQSKTQDF